MQSHPEWVRGLKLHNVEDNHKYETSHPEWVRGLKLISSIVKLQNFMSHPEWVRGLKLILLVRCLLTLGRTPSGCVD